MSNTQSRKLASPFEQRIDFKPRTVQAWELSW